MEKLELLKALKALEIDGSGIDNIDQASPDEVERLLNEIDYFKQGYTVCLNEVKKLILSL